jgi:hypothetical protein
LAPLILTALLAALPFIDRKDDGLAVWFNKQGRPAQIIFGLVVIIVLGLTARAALR